MHIRIWSANDGRRMISLEVGDSKEYLNTKEAKKLAMRLLAKVAELEKPPPDPRQMRMFEQK